MSADSLRSHVEWTAKLSLPYPLVSDPELDAADAVGSVNRFGVGEWGIRLMRRTTLLIARDGRIAGAWGRVKVRSHAAEVLAAAEALDAAG